MGLVDEGGEGARGGCEGFGECDRFGDTFGAGYVLSKRWFMS